MLAAIIDLPANVGYGGHVAEEVISTVGPAAAVLGVAALVAFLVWRHRRAPA